MSEYREVMKKAEINGIVNGVKVKRMTIYRAELIHLRNENLSAKDIAMILDTKVTTVQNWYDKGSQPKDEIIEKLEEMFLEREISLMKKLRKYN